MKNNKLVKLISSFIIGVMFILAVLSVLIVTGVISFGKPEITLKTGSMESLYNGSPLTDHQFEMVGELKDGHRIEYEFISSQTEVGESPNELQYKIYDELDADVTADYNIKHEYGTLKVNPRIVLVVCKDTGGRVPQKDDYAVDEEAYDGLVFDHKLFFIAVVDEEPAEEESSTEEGAEMANEAGVQAAAETSEETEATQSSGSTAKRRWKPVVYDRRNNDVTANYHIIVNVTVNGSGFEGNLDAKDLIDELLEGNSNMLPPVGNENLTLFSVKADNKNKAYLKMRSYGDYDGKSWSAAEPYSALINNRYSAIYLTSVALDNADAPNYNMSIISLCGKYALPYYVSTSAQSDVQTSDVEIGGSANSAYQTSYYSYSALAKLPTSLKSYEKLYARFVRENYLSIDGETLEYMNGIIEREGFDASDPDIIDKVAKYIQNAAEYNLKYDRNLDNESNTAIAFLDVYKEGVCSHYSTAATLLYRALGIPARYTVGAVAYPDGSSYVDVPAKNAHAWVEVYIDGLGWTYVEVTGSLAGNYLEVGMSPSGMTECEMYGHDLHFVEGQEPTCTEDGWTEHLECSREGCEYKEGYEVILELGHDLVFHEKEDPGCFHEGVEEYFECTRCDCLFDKDGEALEEIPYIPPEHQAVYYPQVDPTCYAEGTGAYFQCVLCGTIWDEKGNELEEIPTLDKVDHKPGNPDPHDHCNVRCEFEGCDELLEVNQHPSFAPDPNDGNKLKCTNCGDEKRSQNPGGDGDGDGEDALPYRIYTVITSTNKIIYLRETCSNYVGNGFVAVPDYGDIYEGLPYSPNYIASLVAANSGAKLEEITIKESVDGGYGLPTYLWFGGGYEQQKNDVTYVGNSSQPYTAPYCDFDFLGGAEPIIPNDQAYLTFEAAYREFVYNTYLGLDADTAELAQGIVEAQGWSYDANADYAEKVALINSVASFIRSYRVYDGTYKAESFADAENWAEVFFDKDNYPDAKAVCRHFAASAVVLYKELGIPARYVSGVAVEAKPGRVTDIYSNKRHAWVEIYMDGIGWVIVDVTSDVVEGEPEDLRPVVNVQPENVELQYRNGQTVTYENSYEITGEEAHRMGLPYGYSIKYTVFGQASKLGKHDIIDAFNVGIFDENGEDVTKQYQIKYAPGILHIYRDIIYLSSNDYERVFNGKIPGYEDGGFIVFESGTLEDGYYTEYTFTANSGVGTFANSFTVKILNTKSGNTTDVTDEYLIYIRFGKVTSTPAPITFTAGSASKDYDGTPLTCDEIIYDASELVEGHWVDIENCIVEGEATDPTAEESYNNFIIKVVIRDSQGNDVSDWYEKTYIPGKLTVIW